MLERQMWLASFTLMMYRNHGAAVRIVAPTRRLLRLCDLNSHILQREKVR